MPRQGWVAGGASQWRVARFRDGPTAPFGEHNRSREVRSRRLEKALRWRLLAADRVGTSIRSESAFSRLSVVSQWRSLDQCGLRKTQPRPALILRSTASRSKRRKRYSKDEPSIW